VFLLPNNPSKVGRDATSIVSAETLVLERQSRSD